MNWIDFAVAFSVTIALLAVLFYKLYPVIFKKKRLSRKARNLIHDYKKAKRKEEKEKDKKK